MSLSALCTSLWEPSTILEAIGVSDDMERQALRATDKASEGLFSRHRADCKRLKRSKVSGELTNDIISSVAVRSVTFRSTRPTKRVPMTIVYKPRDLEPAS